MVKLKRLGYRTVSAGIPLLCALLSITGYTQTRSDDQKSLPPIECMISREWQEGGFISYGFAPDYSIHTSASSYDLQLHFLNAGLQAGRMLTTLHGPGVLRGRVEANIEVMPFWRASFPRQTITVHFRNPLSGTPTSIFGPYAQYGVTITPLLLRWNFIQHEGARVMPWAQLGGGLLWTNHKFPPIGGSTSVINFTPQGGIGVSLFVKPHQSLDFGIKAVHISSAGLGDSNPGVNATLQFSAGYSWWK